MDRIHTVELEEAIRELEELEVEEEAALVHLLDSTMIIVFENSIIVRRIY